MSARLRSRLRPLATIIAVGAGLCLSACSENEARSPAPRNLLLITLDTLRADHLGCYGYPRPTSPAIDAFADRSTVFADVTCSIPTTLPSHVTIFTGLPPEVHGITRNGMEPESDLETVFDLLQRQGRRTAAIVSAWVLQERFLNGFGFQEVIFDRDGWEVVQIKGDVVTDGAVRWLNRHSEEPFALWLHYFDPHEPYDPPADVVLRFASDYTGPLADTLPIDWLVSLNDPAVEASLSEDDRQHVVDLYDAEVAYLDHQLGRVFAALEEHGLWRNTLVAVVADHGQAHGEDGFWGHGERLLEPVIKVPMMLHHPGQVEGRVVEAAVETLDLAPTIADLFQLDGVPIWPGRSLAAAVTGAEFEPNLRRMVVRRSFPEQPNRSGLVMHRVESKGTYYSELEGERFHIGRIDGPGGLDGQNFYVEGSTDSRWFAEEVDQFLERRQVRGGEISERDLEMLRALGYTQ